MSLEPLLTIVTPTYNVMRYIRETAEGVLRLDFPVEWIVIDNKSTDGTVEYLQSLGMPEDRLRIIVNPFNFGSPVPNYVKGTRLARGRYITYPGGDDVIPSPEAYRRGLQALEEHPELGAAICKVAYMTQEGQAYKVKRIPFVHYERILKGARLLWIIFFSPTYPVKEGAILYRRSVVERLGHTIDMELLLGACKITDFFLVDEIALNYRNTHGSQSFGNTHDGYWWPLIKQFLPCGERERIRYLMYGYRLAVGYVKSAYRSVTPNRI
jgi:glycosyltransferase involved in cell wall biosynthesis